MSKTGRHTLRPTDRTEDNVARHYARSDLEQAILEALAASGRDIDRLTPDDLAPVDEFHTGGRQATAAFAERLDAAPGSHLLDIGCGIGGPSRFLALQYSCRVTGIDLTEDYVRVATALAERVRLAGRVVYRQASALALPFDAGVFDGAYMMHVGMNVADKAKLAVEVRRVLKLGGVFAIYDVMRTGDGDLRFPVHWAATGETSFVARPTAYRQALSGAGFEIVSERDRGDFAREFFRQVVARAAEAGEPPPLGIHLLMKNDVPQKIANVVHALENRLVAPVEIVARAR